MRQIKSAAVCVVGIALCGGSAFGQAAYTNTFTATVNEAWGDSTQWNPNGVPGFNIDALAGNSNDIAALNFFNTSSPQLDLRGSNYVLQSLVFLEGSGNSDLNFISSTGPASLTVQGLFYPTGGRTVDLQTNITFIDWADGNAFVVDTEGGSGFDFGGPVQGSEGLRISGNDTLYFRNYQISYGSGLSNSLIFGGAAGGTKNFWIDASAGDVTHTIDNMVIEVNNNNAQNIDFGRSAGTNMLTVNISNVIFSSSTADRLYIGGGSDPDGAPSTTVNVLGQVVLTNEVNTTKTIQIDSVYDGVVNFHSNIVQNDDVDTLLVFQGNGVANILADMQHTNGSPRSDTVRIDGAKGLTVAVDAESRLGTGEIDLRSGSVLKLNYDVFGDPNGFPGSSITNRGGINALNDTYLEFGVVQSSFFDPITGDTGTPLTVYAFNGIAGNLSNAVYSGPGQNIIVQTNAIIGENALNKPTFADVGQSVWAGIRDAGGTYTNVGLADGTNIFRGVAIGAITPQGNGDLPNTQGNPNVDTFLSGFHGTLSAAPGLDLELLISGEVFFSPRTNDLIATFNADTGIANVRGPGNMILQSRNPGTVITALTGNVTNINRIGRGGIVSELNPLGLNDQNQIGVDLIGATALEDGDTITATDVQVRLRGGDNLGSGTGTTNTMLIIGSGASLLADNGTGNDAGTVTYNRGKIVFQDDGAFYTGTQPDRINSTTANFVNAMTFGSNSLFIINDGSSGTLGTGGFRDLDTPLYTHMLTNMNIVWGDDGMRTAFVASASAFALGDGRRLTGPGNENPTIWGIQYVAVPNGVTNIVGSTTNISDLIGDAPLTAAAGAGNVTIAPRGGGSLTIQTEVNLTNALQTTVGAEGLFTSIVADQSTRTNIGQNGQLNLYGPTNLLNQVRVVAGANLLFGNEPSDVTRIFGNVVVEDSTNVVTTLRFNAGDGQVFGNIFMDGTSITNSGGGATAAILQFFASNTVIHGNVYLGPTNAGTGSSGVDFGSAEFDSTTITGDLVIDTPAKRSNTAQEFSRGDLVVSNNIIINASGIDYRAINGTNETTYYGGSRLLIEADFDTNHVDGIGFHDRLVNGTLAQGPDGIVIKDFGTLRMDFVRTNLPDAVDYTIAQKITIDNTGPNYWFNDGRVLEVIADTNIIYGISGAGNPTIEVTNIWMRDGSFLRANSANDTVRLGIIVDGPTTNGIATLSDTADGDIDNLDILDVRSGSPGMAKVLQIGATNGRLNPDGVTFTLDDIPYTNNLRGVASADITLDVFNGRLTVDQANGGDIQGSAVVRDGSVLRIGTSGTGTEELLNIAGNGMVLGNLIVSNTLSPGLSPGTLTVTGAMTFLPTSILAFELDGTTTNLGGGINDLLVLAGANGNLTLDGTLNVTELSAFTNQGWADGDFWTLITYEGGIFNDNGLDLGTLPTLDDGLMWALDTSITGEIRLAIVIPEPSTWALLAIGFAAVGVLSRRRRRG